MGWRTYVVQAASIVGVRDDLYRSIRAIRHVQAVGQHDTTFGPAEVPRSVLLYRRTDDGVKAAANIVTNSEGNGDEILGMTQLEGERNRAQRHGGTVLGLSVPTAGEGSLSFV